LAQLGAGLGMRFDPEWFDAQREFRFPRLGGVSYEGVDIELRGALEPWPVLGEEGAAGGTARFVDSSVERLQVRASGDAAALDRLEAQGLAISCNGMRLPLQRADDGALLCGVRFRTWWPTSCLHPTVPPHGPLVFDLVDPGRGRSLGGCTYHSAHPGGRNFERQPINALEADGRRLSRFDPFGHTPGPVSLLEPVRSPEFPHTLDLRAQHGFV
ncbi:MAG: transglutaminase family protein, partial [Pseudomonadota bacterium]